MEVEANWHQLVTPYIQKALSLAGSIPDFDRLSAENRSHLLEQGWLSLAVLQLCREYDDEKQTLSLANGGKWTADDSSENCKLKSKIN